MQIVSRNIAEPLDSLDGPVQDVLVWHAEFSQLSEQPIFLTPEEQARRDRYKSETVQRQFAVTRSLLRRLLGHYLNLSPLEVMLTSNAEGKPELLQPALHFNVSHSDTHALVAIANRPVGVDLEAIRPMPTAGQLVERFFEADELAIYHSLPETKRLRGFFHGWTCKEAVLKGLGCGTRALHRCRVNMNPDEPAQIIGPSDTQRDWQLFSWSITSEVLAALAVHVERN
jgi:4'-phosphopantetheinyl transferase